MKTYAQQIAEAVREAAAKENWKLRCRDEFEPEFHDKMLKRAEDAIRSLDLDAIIASVPKEPVEQTKTAQGASYICGCHMTAPYKCVPCAKRDALTQARELTDAEICEIYQRETGFKIDEDPSDLIGFARALLAKKEQP